MAMTRPTPPGDLDPLDPVALAIDLMRIDSTSGREGEVIAFVEAFLERRGWATRRIPVTAGRDDLLAEDDLLAQVHDGPAVTLSTHLDTVPPYIAPRLDGSRLWGRGACDAKGIAAAMICAAERLRAQGVAVALLFVVGEEVSHDGAHAANEAAGAGLVPATSRILVNGEPTESTLALGTKGAIRLTFRTHGEAAHSAYPHLGRSAIDDLVRLLMELQRLKLPADPLLGDTTVNVGTISGGVADNVIAPLAEARIMVRLVTPPEEIAACILEWVGSRAEVELGVAMPPVRLATLAGFPTSVAAFATDIPALSKWGTPYLFGPGSVRFAHRDDEHAEVEEIRAAVGAYERIVRGAMAAV